MLIDLNMNDISEIGTWYDAYHQALKELEAETKDRPFMTHKSFVALKEQAAHTFEKFKVVV